MPFLASLFNLIQQKTNWLVLSNKQSGGEARAKHKFWRPVAKTSGEEVFLSPAASPPKVCYRTNNIVSFAGYLES